jgi:AraC family transcriptional regulator of adaptative response / DNA-3-methyladenine glycosylase II
VTLEAVLRPVPPYSLAASVRMRSDATRVFRDGVLTLVYEREREPALARVHQRPDGALAVRLVSAAPEAALAHLRFMLAVDDDHSEFLERFADDPVLGRSFKAQRGLRPLRAATVTHALLKAVCGQLIQARAARLLEARLLRLAGVPYEGLHLPPNRATFASFGVADLEAHGLVARKAGALVRLSREVDLERLHRAPSPQVAARIERERGLGPWSAAMIAIHGLGRFDLGLVGDLGLIKLCSALRGRRADAEDTRELLEPYGEWAGLASVYLLAGVGRAYGAGRRPFARRSWF